jgi:hypothetical protein
VRSHNGRVDLSEESRSVLFDRLEAEKKRFEIRLLAQKRIGCSETTSYEIIQVIRIKGLSHRAHLAMLYQSIKHGGENDLPLSDHALVTCGQSECKCPSPL